jgi:hypothetical protein
MDLRNMGCEDGRWMELAQDRVQWQVLVFAVLSFGFCRYLSGTDEKTIRNFGCKTEGKRPLGRPRRRWEENIRMNLGEIGWEGVDWMHLAQDRDQWRAVVNTVMNLRVP